MENPVGFRFNPTDEEIVDYYLRHKNMGSNSINVDQAISTVNIYSFDPWELPSQSRMETSDQVWYFFCEKKNRGGRQSRKTKSGSWKKTGVTMDIKRKRGHREKMGEKRVFVFRSNAPKSSNWAMHEYLYQPTSTFFSPYHHSMRTYTVCKLHFKGEETEFSSSGCENYQHIDNQELHNTSYNQERALGNPFQNDIDNLLNIDWIDFDLADDYADDEFSKFFFMQ